MTWRDDIRRVQFGERTLIGASFRGVPFYVEASDRTGGRRTVVTEIPFRDEPAVEEYGRRARIYSVTAYVIGDNYVADRDALLAALENEAGPGELVHPYFGTMRAICSNLGVSESRDEGRIARFGIEFTWVPPSLAPGIATDFGSAANAAAAAANALSEAEFTEGFDPAGLPSFALASAASALTAAAEAMDTVLGPVVQLTQDAALLRVNLMSITGQAASLVTAPADVVAALAQVFVDLADTALESPGRLAGAMARAYGLFESEPLAPDTTPRRQQERANQIALDNLIRRYLAIECARLTVLASFETIDAATAARGVAADLLDAQAEVADDATYSGLMDLRAVLAAAVPGDAVLARLVSKELPESTPSLVLSYRLYESVQEADAIVARNAIRHPLFVPGGRPILVLSDV